MYIDVYSDITVAANFFRFGGCVRELSWSDFGSEKEFERLRSSFVCFRQ